jgi:cell division control protein 7
MVNKPAVPKNLFYVNFILELTSLFGADAVTKICLKFGILVFNLGYDLNLPSVVAKAPVKWASVIAVGGFDDKAENLLS